MTELKRWERPDSFMAFEDDWCYSKEAFVFLGRHRESDLLVQSNFECGLKAIGGESDTVKIVRESHCAVGWVEWIAIHESDTVALEKANEIMAALDDYPIINEDHFSQLEWDAAHEYWESCSIAERVELCQKSGVSVFAARHSHIPDDDRYVHEISWMYRYIHETCLGY